MFVILTLPLTCGPLPTGRAQNVEFNLYWEDAIARIQTQDTMTNFVGLPTVLVSISLNVCNIYDMFLGKC